MYGPQNRPYGEALKRIVERFHRSGPVEYQKAEKYSHSGRALENIYLLPDEEPKRSISRLSQVNQSKPLEFFSNKR